MAQLQPTGSADSVLTPPTGFTATISEVDFLTNRNSPTGKGSFTLTVTGLLGGTQTFTGVAPAGSAQFSKVFAAPIAASGINTAITATLSGMDDSDMIRVRAVGTFS
jgi:hypothetical protein